MKKKLLVCLATLLCTITGKAQMTENFTDGNFSANPPWIGNTTDWIVNPALQLQSNNTIANSSYYLSTPSTMATMAQWEFYCQLSFNTSSANYADVYLTASASDISMPATTGYFVRIGSTDDDICLYRKDATGTVVKLVDGVNGILNTSNNTLKIRVARNAANQWNVERDITGTGTSYISEGLATDATYTGSAFFGILVKQSTASFFQRHFFDDITIKTYVPDITPPVIQTATATSSTTVEVLFNEPVEQASAGVAANYTIDNGIGMPVSAIRDAANPALVHLTFIAPLPARINLLLTVNAVKDIAGNAAINATAAFAYFIPYQYDVVIDEIMADPTPQVSLPNSEWIEIKNTSAFAIDLAGWRIGDAGSQSGPIPAYILQPDSFAIICSATAVAGLQGYGTALAVTGFPSLDNTTDQLSLLSPQGKTIHAVAYTDDWYKNELKKQGGWTLEMIDPRNACSGSSNWLASTDSRGGSPAKKNAVDAVNADHSAPQLLHAFASTPVDITLVFDEPLDSTKAAVVNSYSISDGVGTPQTAVAIAPLFNQVSLHLVTALLPGKVYTVTANGVTDCAGNNIGSARLVRVGVSVPADSFAVVINEILFNPPANGVDYVELYNRSNNIIDLKQLYIANRNSSNIISSIAQLSTSSYLLFPKDYIVVTANPAAVKASYVAMNPGAFTSTAMPSFNDDAGDAVILNAQGKIIDELAYSEKWHFKLIDNDEGVALERIDFDAPTQNNSNWHSAATSVGYGTPTYRNSQYRSAIDVQGEITVSPKIVSPDNDGLDDFATIDYTFPEPGYVANITVFDAAGRMVRYVQQSALCGTKGYFRWDGLGEKNQRLPVGIYVLYSEVFNLSGKKKQFKNVIVLARK